MDYTPDELERIKLLIPVAEKNVHRAWNGLCPACGGTDLEELPTVNLMRKLHCHECKCLFGVQIAKVVASIFWLQPGQKLGAQ